MEGLHYPRPCGCQGIRSCLICEERNVQTAAGTAIPSMKMSDVQDLWKYCYMCGKVQPPLRQTAHEAPSRAISNNAGCCSDHVDSGFVLPGIQIVPDFITEEEEVEIVHTIEQSPWKPSQSGRYKQDYGPKPNFKRRKVKPGGFSGLPPFIEPFVSRMTRLDSLRDFLPVEQCHLEYAPERGSAIDLHFDDFWLWGDRLVTLNLLSDTFLLLKLDDAQKPGAEVGSGSGSDGEVHSGSECPGDREHCERKIHASEVAVAVPMPRRSLLVLSDDARYKWKHAVPREAIASRRIAVTLRELAAEFLPGGAREVEGRKLLDIALTYKGQVVQ